MQSVRSRLRSTVSGSVIVSLALASAASPGVAQPRDGRVVAGEATIEQPSSGSTVIQQRTPRVVIDWRSFDTRPSDTVRFDQPSRNSIALNRISNGLPTDFQGELLANGNVWIINPNGIVFSRTARVDVAGLVATTLDIDNHDFMAGRYQFSGSGPGSATVSNAGRITVRDAGLAALVAPGVENSGVIEARFGRVTLGSTSAFAIDLYGDGLTRFRAPDALEQSLRRLGRSDGKVLLTVDAARAIIDDAVVIPEAEEAAAVRVADGSITLLGPASGSVRVSGTVDVSGPGGTGGAIDVTGRDVHLASSARLDASGSVNGGTVRVGGAWQGGASLPSATTANVDEGAQIRVDGGTGSGGTSVVWSDGHTRFAGSILATGDRAGGEAEVSGKRTLDFTGSVDLRSASGRHGTLLLDPRNVVIAADGTSPSLPGSGPITFNPVTDESRLSLATLLNALSLGNVVVTTGSDGSQAGDIRVEASINWSGANSLSLEAFRNIVLGPGITIANTGSGNLTLRADSTGIGTGTVFGASSNITRLDWRNSTGLVKVLYNPSGGYANPGSSLDNFDVLHNPNLVRREQVLLGMLVNTAQQLQAINTNLSGTYALGRNIDARDTASWNGGLGFNPIGTAETTGIGTGAGVFQGILDGQGYTIQGLVIGARQQGSGLFRSIGANAIVSDLNLAEARLTLLAQSNDAGLLAGQNAGRIRRVHVQGSITGPAAGSAIGGLVGTTEANLTGGISSIEDSSARVVITLGTTSTNPNFTAVGGLVGSHRGEIVRSSATGSISSSAGGRDVGGLIGSNGGFRVEDSYAVVSLVMGPGSERIGGFVGSSQGPIRRSYSASQVGGSQSVGAFAGSIASANGCSPFPCDGSITSSYWDRDRTTLPGIGNVSGGTPTMDVIGLSTAQLKSGLPAGFDPAVWLISSSINEGYPSLHSHIRTPAGGSIVNFGNVPLPPPPPPPPPPPTPPPPPPTPTPTPPPPAPTPTPPPPTPTPTPTPAPPPAPLPPATPPTPPPTATPALPVSPPLNLRLGFDQINRTIVGGGPAITTPDRIGGVNWSGVRQNIVARHRAGMYEISISRDVKSRIDDLIRVMLAKGVDLSTGRRDAELSVQILGYLSSLEGIYENFHGRNSLIATVELTNLTATVLQDILAEKLGIRIPISELTNLAGAIAGSYLYGFVAYRN